VAGTALFAQTRFSVNIGGSAEMGGEGLGPGFYTPIVPWYIRQLPPLDLRDFYGNVEKENALADQLRIDIGRDRLLLNQAIERGNQKQEGRALAELSRDQAALDRLNRHERDLDHEYNLHFR